MDMHLDHIYKSKPIKDNIIIAALRLESQSMRVSNVSLVIRGLSSSIFQC